MITDHELVPLDLFVRELIVAQVGAEAYESLEILERSLYPTHSQATRAIRVAFRLDIPWFISWQTRVQELRQ